jgi:hypothetical protein
MASSGAAISEMLAARVNGIMPFLPRACDVVELLSAPLDESSIREAAAQQRS